MRIVDQRAVCAETNGIWGARFIGMKVGVATAMALVGWVLLITPARGAEPVCPPKPLPSVLSLPNWRPDGFQFRLDGAEPGTYLLQVSTNLRGWTTFSTNDAAEAHPWIQMPTTHQSAFVRAVREDPVYPLFNFAVRAGVGIVSNSIGIFVDSYDSSDPNYSTMGQYDPLKAKDGANLALGFGDDGVHYLGSSEIKGRVFTAGSSTVALGPNGKIGSTAWHLGSNSGIEPGWVTNNLRPTFMPPAVAVPFTVGDVPTAGIVGGVAYDYILGNGDYQLSALSGSRGMLVTGHARLFVSGTIDARSIQISTNASLQIFCGGDTIFGTVSNSGDVSGFQCYGLPSCFRVRFTPNATIKGLIYAPDARCSLYSGGATFWDFCGALIVRELFVAQRVSIHFDEHLKRFCPP